MAEPILHAERVRLATIVDEAFGPQPVLTTTELLSLLEAKLFEQREKRELLLAELAAWRSGALSHADCCCVIQRSKKCPVHSADHRRLSLPPAFTTDAEHLVSRWREPRGSIITAPTLKKCADELEALVRRFLP